MTGQTLSAIAGVVISLAFSYIPGLRDWYNTFNSQQKQAGMALVLICVTLVVFGLSCANVVGAVACDKGGAIGLVEALIMAMIANQSMYSMSKHIVNNPE